MSFHKKNIYHITHLDNLPSIISDGCLWSDKELLLKTTDVHKVGMNHIKARRLNEIQVTCHESTFVGDYVPFYFCPRSVMLFMLYKGNHQDISYDGGQEPIIHLEINLTNLIKWALKSKKQWAFSDRNAGSKLAEFFKDENDSDKINWDAIPKRYWNDPIIKEQKQAEFLVYENLPIKLISAIGVYDDTIKKQVEQHLKSTPHKPLVVVKRDWYY